MKEFLSRERVSFTVRNIDEDARAYDELVARGFRTVPTTMIGERAIKGYDPHALKSAIAGLSSGR